MTNNQPLVSIVIPCYNHEKYVQESIQSVIEQDYDNIELIIIDDGSNDNSVIKIEEMIQACQQRFTRFEFRHRPNEGLCATLNEALAWCEGEFFSALASDDIILSHKTSTQVDYLKNNDDCIGVFGKCHVFGNKETPKYTNLLKKKVRKYKFNDIYLHKHNLPAPTQFLRAEVLKNIGGYNPEVILEDWYMWLAMTKGRTLHLAQIDQVFSHYRKHLGNTSANIDLMHAGRLEVINIFKENGNYKLACSNCFLAAAITLISTSKKKSLGFFLKGITYYPLSLFQVRVLKYFVQLLVY